MSRNGLIPWLLAVLTAACVDAGAPGPVCETDADCPDGWACEKTPAGTWCAPKEPACSLECGPGYRCAAMSEKYLCILKQDQPHAVRFDTPLDGTVFEGPSLAVRCETDLPQTQQGRIDLHPPAGDPATLVKGALTQGALSADWDTTTAADGTYRLECAVMDGPAGFRSEHTAQPVTVVVDRLPPDITVPTIEDWQPARGDCAVDVTARDLGTGVTGVKTTDGADCPRVGTTETYRCSIDLSPASKTTQTRFAYTLTAYDGAGRSRAVEGTLPVDGEPPTLQPLPLNYPNRSDGGGDYLSRKMEFGVRAKVLDSGSGLGASKEAQRLSVRLTYSDIDGDSHVITGETFEPGYFDFTLNPTEMATDEQDRALLRLTATDLVGNSASATMTVIIKN